MWSFVSVVAEKVVEKSLKIIWGKEQEHCWREVEQLEKTKPIEAVTVFKDSLKELGGLS